MIFIFLKIVVSSFWEKNSTNTILIFNIVIWKAIMHEFVRAKGQNPGSLFFINTFQGEDIF